MQYNEYCVVGNTSFNKMTSKWKARRFQEISIILLFKINLKNSLRIHEENTKENRNLVVSLYVIKTRLLFSSNFLGLENVNFQTFFAN